MSPVFQNKEVSVIFLIGYMGAGKSTVGKLLARRLEWKYIELDHIIELMQNIDIDSIFQNGGEPLFRKAEREALLSLNKLHNTVVSTGGGCPTYSDNIEWMRRNGMTIYLKVHPGTLYHRIAPNKHTRPMIASLNDVDLMVFIIESLKNRLPFYQQADLTITADSEADIVAGMIEEKIKN